MKSTDTVSIDKPHGSEAWLEGGSEREKPQPLGPGLSLKASADQAAKGPSVASERTTSASVREVFATLTCGHSRLWDDPDEDVRGSFLCGECGLYCGVVGFR